MSIGRSITVPSTSGEITALLKRSRTDKTARQSVYEMIYQDLRRLAGHRVATSRPGETLSVTALVSEAYLKLSEHTGHQWSDRQHFLSVASIAMRQITIDHVRAKLAKKRGAGEAVLPLDGLEVAGADKPAMVLALEEGLQQLNNDDPRMVRVVECRFFAGLSIADTALALDMSESTVERDWRRARTWLKEYLT